MSLLDTIKDKVLGTQGDDYYEDDYYDEGDYEDDGYDRDPREPHHRDAAGGNGRLLGTAARPEVESVSVYTRSGRPVAQQEPPATRSYTAPSSYLSHADATPGAASVPSATTSFSRVTSGQLPPYVLRPVSYEDVQTVVRRVKTNQPVVIVFRNTNIETAKRVLDFCFGFSYGIDGSVEELGDRVFCVLPAGVRLSQADIDKLVADGDLTR